MRPTDFDDKLLEIEAELYLYARALTRENTRAEDLLQETNLKILAKQGKYKEKSKFRSWAKKIMKNSFLNNVDHEKNITTVEDYSIFYKEMTYTPCCAESEVDDIYHAIDRLPDGYDKMIRLLVTGHRYDEIAGMLDLPLGTVKSRIFSSREILRKELRDYL